MDCRKDQPVKTSTNRLGRITIAQMPDVNVRYRGQSGKHMLVLSSSEFVKGFG